LTTPSTHAPQRGTAYLYLAVFASGMTTLAMELSASRLLGNVFGASNLVWANVIGLILLYLTAGYFIGGRWADRSPRFTTFYRILVWSAFLCALIPLVARPVLRTAGGAVVGVRRAWRVCLRNPRVLFSCRSRCWGVSRRLPSRLAVSDLSGAGDRRAHLRHQHSWESGRHIRTGAAVILELGTFRTFLHCSRPVSRRLGRPLVV
jgi:hypothetical protein